MTLTLIAAGAALWLAIAIGVAVGIGRAITTADRQQAAETARRASVLRLVS